MPILKRKIDPGGVIEKLGLGIRTDTFENLKLRTALKERADLLTH